MADITGSFRSWVLDRHPLGLAAQEIDSDHIRFTSPTHVAEVNLYPLEDSSIICELRITRTSDDEGVFFLHFLLEEMGRAKDLFRQMEQALADETSHVATRILLCCTSALTTSMFASKMQDGAKALSLDYEISAKPADVVLALDEDVDAILLAPQVAHLRHKMREAHPQALVFEIPAKIFGRYDTGGALRLLMQAMREVRDSAQDTRLSAVRDLSDNRRILIITHFILRDCSLLGYRLYERGSVIADGSVRKPALDFRDVEDLLETINLRGVELSTLDAIGIAVPGVAYRGRVSLVGVAGSSYDLGPALSKRFRLPVYVDNNCNAAAVGCYVSQEEHESLIFYRHAFGHAAGGFGTMIDGRLLKGRLNLAGEPMYFERSYAFETSYDESLWSADGLLELATDVLASAIALISPDACYVAVDTIDDAADMEASLSERMPSRFVPPVTIVNDYVDRVYLGELALCLQKLRDPKYRSLGVSVMDDET